MTTVVQQRDPARVAKAAASLAAQHEDEQRADQRQEGDESREIGQLGHRSEAPRCNMTQVKSDGATPISMAKA